MESPLLTDTSADSCFLCDPEDWRVILRGQHNRIMAGLGPLCPGYVILAPIEHVHTAARLQGPAFWEFLAMAEVIACALQIQYRPGYTAYEHGQLGACRPREMANDFSTYCHHAHRVYIPRSVNCLPEVERWFNASQTLRTPESVALLSDSPYVYYETGEANGSSARHAFAQDKGIPSQFMRRILTTALRTGRPWDWAEDLNLREVVETVARLRGDTMGLDFEDDSDDPPSVSLQSSISIDGLPRVGKTSVATILSRCTGSPSIDTGLIFRYIAYRESNGLPAGSVDEVLAFLQDAQAQHLVRGTPLEANLMAVAKDERHRDFCRHVVQHAIESSSSVILIGRDTWQYLPKEGISILIDADLETRARRHILTAARDHARAIALPAAREQLRIADSEDRSRLPPRDRAGLIVVSNGRRPISATVSEILHRIGGHSEH